MSRLMVSWLLVVLASVATAAPPPAGSEATSPIPQHLARLLDPLKAGGNRAGGLRTLAQSLHNNPALRDEPAVLAAVADCAADEDADVRAEAARTIGQVWVWGKKPQNPRAIELEMKLARDKSYEVVHNAVYFGLSTADEKTDAVIEAMLDAAATAKAYDPINLHGRIAWGLGREPPERLAKLFERHWAKADENPLAAFLVYRLYEQTTKREPPKPERYAEAKAKVEAAEAARKAELRKLTPELAEALTNGDSATRRATMQRIYTTEGLFQYLDPALFDALAAAAEDPDQLVRSEVARLTGNAWVWSAREQNPALVEKVVGLALRLAKDPQWQVRHYAVYFTLSTTRNKSDEVIKALLENAIVRVDNGSVDRAAWGLKQERPERVAPFFEAYFARAKDDPALAGRAVAFYRSVFGRDPPGGGQFPGLDVAAKNYEQAFQDLYDHLGRQYPNFAMKQIDWKQVGEELLPRAKTVKDDEAFGLLCMELVAKLQDSHAMLQPGTATPPVVPMPEWDVGIACLIDDRDRPVVFDVVYGSPAGEAGIRPGAAVVSVNGKPAEELIAAYMRRAGRYFGYSSDRVLRYEAARLFARQEERGAMVKLVLEDPDGKRRELELSATGSGRRYIPRRPVAIPGSDDAADVSSANLGGGVGYVYVRRIRGELPESLDAALKGLGDIQGLIIDVRGNSGGGFDARRAVRNFNPDDNEEPQRPRFKGPIALLVDERCISAGEGWASWFVATKRAKLFGTATAGASARKETYRLSNGLYSVIVPVKAYTGSLDRPIERRGLEPDVPVRCNAKDLAAGEDTVLEAARRYLIDASGEASD